MSNPVQTNAMAEIALALAMGFFSIMILAMVSMGGNSKPECSMVKNTETDKGLNVAATEAEKPSDNATGNIPISKTKLENLLIFFKGKYLDGNLTETDPNVFARNKTKIVLAVDAKSDFLSVTAARDRVPIQNILVVPLNKTWSKLIKEKFYVHEQK